MIYLWNFYHLASGAGYYFKSEKRKIEVKKRPWMIVLLYFHNEKKIEPDKELALGANLI